MIKTIANLKDIGRIVQSDGDLCTNVKDLKGKLISICDEALVRIETSGKENIGATEGTRTAVEVDYVKGDFPVALKYDKLNPEIAKMAVKANFKNKYLCTDSTERYDTHRKVAEKEENSEVLYRDRTAIVLPRSNFSMSPSENSSLFSFFFEDMAKSEGDNSYFAFNKKVPIKVYLIDKDIIDGKKYSNLLQNPNGTIVVPCMWFGCLVSGSGLLGYGGADSGSGGARGVLSAPKAQQKISGAGVPYTNRQIHKYAAKVQNVRNALKSGKIDLSKLEAELAEVSEFLDKQ